MGEWFVGEIRSFPYTQGVPTGWLECAGQTLAISQNQALYALLGVQFGGNGTNNFAIPDLRGRVPVGAGTMPDTNRVVPSGSALPVGTKAGTESVSLTVAQMPAHSHGFTADPNNTIPAATLANSFPSTNLKPGGAAPSAPAASNVYAPPSVPAQALIVGSIQPTGSGTAHENRQPFLPLRYCIATTGIFPSRQ